MNIESILSLPKTFYVNFKYFSFNIAIKRPVKVSYHTKIININGSITLMGNIKTGMISIGYAKVGVFDATYSRSILDIGGKINFKGVAIFGQGSKICVEEGGILTIGDNYINSAEGTIHCKKQIIIGDNTVSYDTFITDTDSHATIDTQTKKVSSAESPVFVGDNVWIGMKASVLKGSKISDGSIVAACSLVNKVFEEENILLAGIPAKCVKQNRILKR